MTTVTTMRYQLAIFDFDGTLADSFPWFSRIINSVAEKYRFKRIEAHEVDLLRSYGARQIIAHLGVPMWKLPLVTREMRRLATRDVGEIRLFPGVEEMLARLAGAGVTLAIVSSNSAENVRRVLGPEHAARVGHYACGASVFGKRAHIRKVLKQSGVARGRAICIGDELRDLDAAHAESTAFGAVAWGYTSAASLATRAPTEMFGTVEEIAARLAG